MDEFGMNFPLSFFGVNFWQRMDEFQSMFFICLQGVNFWQEWMNFKVSFSSVYGVWISNKERMNFISYIFHQFKMDDSEDFTLPHWFQWSLADSAGLKFQNVLVWHRPNLILKSGGVRRSPPDYTDSARLDLDWILWSPEDWVRRSPANFLLLHNLKNLNVTSENWTNGLTSVLRRH